MKIQINFFSLKPKKEVGSLLELRYLFFPFFVVTLPQQHNDRIQGEEVKLMQNEFQVNEVHLI